MIQNSLHFDETTSVAKAKRFDYDIHAQTTKKIIIANTSHVKPKTSDFYKYCEFYKA